MVKKIIYGILVFIIGVLTLILGGQAYEDGIVWLGLLCEVAGGGCLGGGVAMVGWQVIKQLTVKS